MSLQDLKSADWFADAVMVTGMLQADTFQLASGLSTHPNLFMLPMEMPFHGEGPAGLEPLRAKIIEAIDTGYRDLSPSTISRATVEHLVQQLTLEHSTDSLPALFSSLLKAVAETLSLDLENVRAWGLKSTFNEHLDVFLGAFPKSKLIHISRDPRDFLLERAHFHAQASSRPRGLRPTPYHWPYVRYEMKHWNRMEKRVEAARRQFGSARVYILRYEDFASKPATQMAEVLEFLKLPPLEAKIDRLAESTAQAERSDHRSSVGQRASVTGPSAESWRGELPRGSLFITEAMAVEHLANPHFRRTLLRLGGYLLKFLDPLSGILEASYCSKYMTEPKQIEYCVCEHGHRFRWIGPASEFPVRNCIYCQASICESESVYP